MSNTRPTLSRGVRGALRVLRCRSRRWMRQALAAANSCDLVTQPEASESSHLSDSERRVAIFLAGYRAGQESGQSRLNDAGELEDALAGGLGRGAREEAQGAIAGRRGPSCVTIFASSEVRQATSNFAAANRIGGGGFGHVYLCQPL